MPVQIDVGALSFPPPAFPLPLPVARSPISSYTMCALGELPEWSIGAVSKTVEGYALRGFESLTLRGVVLGSHAWYLMGGIRLLTDSAFLHPEWWISIVVICLFDGEFINDIIPEFVITKKRFNAKGNL